MQTYLVGGAVRDQLLNYPVFDKDWVVVGATAEEMLAQGFQPVGQDFPVFIHPDTGEEYALARTERKSGKGYTGFQYFASQDVSLEEDLIRRDLTINAMAQDHDGNIIDPYHGQEDLKQKLLRHVSPAFSEDPLRVLRVARFAARYHHLGFRVAPETIKLMQEISATDELEHLTAERVWKELERALGEPSPEIFIDCLKQSNALPKVIPELAPYALNTLISDFASASQKTLTSETRFACLLSLCNEVDVSTLCARLKAPNAFKELAIQCTGQHISLKAFDKLAAVNKLKTILSLDLIRRPNRIPPLLECIQALHPKTAIEFLLPILEEINSIQPKHLIKEGFKGAKLGDEIEKRRLAICQKFSKEGN
ncbi:MAG: hypothetical protein ACRBB6_01190 [Neptuniibacter sp.]